MAVRLHGPSIAASELAASSVGASELATDAVETAKVKAANVTGAKLAATAFKILSFTGRTGAGACTLTGAAVGDRVLGVAGLTTGALGGAAASFESAITVANGIQQSSASDLSAKEYAVVLLPAAA